MGFILTVWELIRYSMDLPIAGQSNSRDLFADPEWSAENLTD